MPINFMNFGVGHLKEKFITSILCYLSSENKALLQRFARAILESMKSLVRSPDRAAWDVVLPYEKEFSQNQILSLQKELKLLSDYLIGQQHFTMLGTALVKEYQFLLSKMVKIRLISQAIQPNRIFLF